LIPGEKRRRQTTSFKKTLSDDVFFKVVVTTFKKSSLSDNICNVVHRVIDVDCACWHDLTVTVSLFHARFPRARGQQNTATTGHLSVLKPLNPSTPLKSDLFLQRMSGKGTFLQSVFYLLRLWLGSSTFEIFWAGKVCFCVFVIDKKEPVDTL
jgi:hypothetical protein